MKRLFMISFVLLIAGGMIFAASITLHKPNGGEKLNKGSSFVITWTANGTTNPFKVTLWEVGGAQAIGTIKEKSAGDGVKNVNWTVGQLDNGTFVSYGKKYLVKVKEKTTAVADISEAAFEIKAKYQVDVSDGPIIGIVQLESLKPQPHRHRAPPLLEPSNASFSIEKIYYDVNGRGKLTNVKVMITYKSKTAFSFNNYKGHPQDGPVYMNCLIWNPKWPSGNTFYAEIGPPTGEILFNHRLSVKYAGKNHLECAPEIHNIGSGMFQLIFTPSHSNRMQGLDTYQKMGGGGPFSPSRQCKNSYPPKMAVRVFIHTREGVKNLYKEFYLKNTTRKTIPLPGKTESCPGGIVHW